MPGDSSQKSMQGPAMFEAIAFLADLVTHEVGQNTLESGSLLACCRSGVTVSWMSLPPRRSGSGSVRG